MTQVMNVTIWRGHHGDPDHEHRVLWKGRIVGSKSNGTTDPRLGRPASTPRLPGSACTACVQIPCRHALYRPGCNLDVDDFKTAATCSAIAGLTLTVAEAALEADGEYKGGLVIWQGLYGWVEAHAGDQLTLVAPIAGLADEIAANGSAAVDIAPGCDRSRGRCWDRFANGLNHGGFADFTGNEIFTSRIA